MKSFFCVAAVVTFSLVAGCVPVSPIINIENHVQIDNHPSPAQRAFPRGEYVFSCTTVAGLYDKLDNDIVSPGCQMRPMTAVTFRSNYEVGYRSVAIYEFQINGWVYYTYFEDHWDYNWRYHHREHW